MVEEIQDRFGTPPKEVRNLLGLMSIRILLKNMAVIRLDVGRRSLILTFSLDSSLDTERLIQRVSRMKPTSAMKIRL